MNSKLKGGIYGCIAAVSYGMNPLCALYLYEDGINTNSVLFYRFTIAAIILGIMTGCSKSGFRITLKEGKMLALLGVLFAVSSLTYFWSFRYMGAGIAATLVFSYPVMVAAIMAIFFHERLSAAAIAGILMTIAGIGLLCRDDSGRSIGAWGIVLILASALAYALYIVAVNRSNIVMPSTKLTFYALLACLVCIAFYALAGDEVIQPLTTPRQWFFAVLLGLVPTVVSLVFMAMAIREIGSTPTAIMGALEPVTAVVIGIVLFDETFTPRLGLGIALILMAVMFIVSTPHFRAANTVRRVMRRGKLIVKHWHWRN